MGNTDFMSRSDYRRVSRKRVCLICGKPDWCSYTSNETISFCARINKDAHRVSRTGWGVFFHEHSFSPDLGFARPAHSGSKKAELAPPRIRDFAYRKLIELAPAASSPEITGGAGGLRRRGILDFENFGSLPQTRRSRNALAQTIRSLIDKNFPEFVRGKGSGIRGIPGFWLDKNGDARLWKDRDYSIPMLLIPYKTADSLIEACQIRFMNAAPGAIRYVWLSVPEKSGGLTCGSPLHFASRRPLRKDLLITEGALKAETVKLFEPDLTVLATAGVAGSHRQIIEIARGMPLDIGFDSDSKYKAGVARALARLIALRFCDSRCFGYDFDLKILDWDASCGAKGLDDAYLANLEISRLSVNGWITKLNGEAAEEANNVFRNFLYDPSFD